LYSISAINLTMPARLHRLPVSGPWVLAAVAGFVHAYRAELAGEAEYSGFGRCPVSRRWRDGRNGAATTVCWVLVSLQRRRGRRPGGASPRH